MKLTFEAKSFLRILRLVAAFVPKRSNRPALEHALYEVSPPGYAADHDVYLSGTNLEDHVRAGLRVVELDRRPNDPERFGIEVHKALAAWKGVRKGNVSLELVDGGASVALTAEAVPGLRVVLPVLPGDEYPSRPSLPDRPDHVSSEDYEHSLEVRASELKEALVCVLPAVARSTGRYAMHGALLDMVDRRIVGTDSRRLHVRRVTEVRSVAGLEHGFGTGIVPLESLKRWQKALKHAEHPAELARVSILAAEIGHDCAVLELAGEALEIRSHILDGQFPRWEAVVRAHDDACAKLKGGPVALTVDRDEAVQALRSLEPVLTKENRAVRIVLDRDFDQVRLEAGSSSVTFQARDLERGGGSQRMVVNADYLREALESMTTTLPVLRWTGAKTPMSLRGGECEAIVMPIALDT